MRADVEAGSTLEQAMERHPEVFDRLFRAMVRSGEQSGRLEDALDRVAFQVEKADALRRQVKSALMYPALVFGFAAVVLIAIVAFVIPVFANIFKELAEENPAKARRCRCRPRSASAPPNAITGYWFILIPADRGLASSPSSAGRRPKRGKEVWDRFILRIPFKIGDVIQKVALARWSRTFSGSVSAGVPMLQAIKLTGETAGNVVIEQAMEDVYASAKRGGSLAAPIERNAIFPPMVGHMVAVGEETGQLEHDAEQNRRLLRGRGRRQGEGADRADRADDDRLRRRHRRVHRDLDVPADVQHLRKDPLSARSSVSTVWFGSTQ